MSFDRVKDVFLKACELPTTERAAFVAEACGDDSAVRAEVETLLAHDKRSHDVVDDAGARVAAELAAAALPDRIGRYSVIRVIGEGGMGVVYEAEQDDPKRRVALKLIRPGMITRGLLRRFRHEAQVLGQLEHPGIARIYEAGTNDAGAGGQPFFAMELIDGLPLLEHAATRSLGVPERLGLIARICDALHHAHQKGVIHRDLKPGNILVDDTGQPRILDFGVARATDGDLQTVTLQTDVGQLVGTLPYMSPEQASGDPSQLDIRSDVYGVGVILYELLAGHLPYDVAGKPIAEAARIIRDADPSRLSLVSRLYRGDIDTIVATALEKDKDRRYQSAAELAADIRRCLDDQPIVARPPSALYQLTKFAKRNKAVAAGLGIAFVAMFVAMVVSLSQMRIADRRASDLEEAARRAYAGNIGSAASALALGDARAAAEFLDVAARERRGWEHQYLTAQLDDSIAVIEARSPVNAAALTPDGEVIIVTTHGAVERWRVEDASMRERLPLAEPGIGLAAISGDGRRVAAVVGGHESNAVAVWDIVTGARLATLPVADLVKGVAISADGRRVVVQGSDTVVWEPGTATEPRPLADAEPDSFSRARDPLGRWIADGAADGSVLLLDPDTGVPKRVLAGQSEPVDSVAFDADGSRVLSVAGHSVRIYATDANDDAGVLRGHSKYVYGVGFVPDGRVVSGAWDHELRFWQSETGQCLDVLPTERSRVFSLASRPDASIIATGHYVGRIHIREAENGAHLRDVVIGGDMVVALDLSTNGERLAARSGGTAAVVDPSTGEHILRIIEASRTPWIGAVALSPDGSRVAYDAGGGFSVWDTETGDEVQRTDDLLSYVFALAYSPDGKQLAVGCQHGRVLLVDTGTGNRQELIAHTKNVYALAFSPDGRRLASGSDDRTIRIWDTLSGAHLLELTGHDDYIYDLAFSGDGRVLASGSGDHTVRVWGTTTARAAGAESTPSDVPPCVVRPAGVTGWWRGEGDAHDAVGEGHGAAPFGASYAVGLVGRAFALDGQDDHIVIPVPAARSGQNEAITVEAWVRWHGPDGGAIASRVDSSIGDSSWILSVADDGHLAWLVYNHSAPGQWARADTAHPVIRLRAFHHVAVSFDLGTQSMVVHVDGVEQPITFQNSRGTVTTFLANSTVPMRIGAFVPSDGAARGHFNGLIDDLTVYDRALTGDEIRAIHAAGAAGKCRAAGD